MRAVVLDDAGQPALARGARAGRPGRARVACARAGSAARTSRSSAGRPPAPCSGTRWSPRTRGGRRVALVHHLPCGECERCRAGHETTCERFPEPTIVPGGFAERARAAETIPLPDEIDDAAGTFAEPLACVLRAVERVPRGRVLVVGCGFAGLLFVAGARAPRGRRLRRRPAAHRLELALGYGAEPADGPVDAAVLCAHAGLDGALAALEPGGTLLVFSWLAEPAPVDFERSCRRELTLVGSLLGDAGGDARGGRPPPRARPDPDGDAAARALRRGLELYRRHEALKVVFTP